MLLPQWEEHVANRRKNLILSRLSRSDYALLEPRLEPVDLPLRMVLERRGKPITTIYFPESGFASVVANGGKHLIEIGLIGREGMTGLPIVLGRDRNSNEVFMQAAGKGQALRVNDLRKAIDKSVRLHRSLLLYAHAFHEQTARTAVANGRSKIEERLARWLLMASDRLDGDDVPLSHEFLAMMLGVRRPGVTLALQKLERSGVIARQTRRIILKDRAELVKLSNGTYLTSELYK